MKATVILVLMILGTSCYAKPRVQRQIIVSDDPDDPELVNTSDSIQQVLDSVWGPSKQSDDRLLIIPINGSSEMGGGSIGGSSDPSSSDNGYSGMNEEFSESANTGVSSQSSETGGSGTEIDGSDRETGGSMTEIDGIEMGGSDGDADNDDDDSCSEDSQNQSSRSSKDDSASSDGGSSSSEGHAVSSEGDSSSSGSGSSDGGSSSWGNGYSGTTDPNCDPHPLYSDATLPVVDPGLWRVNGCNRLYNTTEPTYWIYGTVLKLVDSVLEIPMDIFTSTVDGVKDIFGIVT